MKAPEPEEIPLINPATELLAELVDESGKTQIDIAGDLGIAPSLFNDILKGRRRITAETALRFGRYFGNRPQYWLNLQTSHELRLAEAEKGAMIAEEVATGLAM